MTNWIQNKDGSRSRRENGILETIYPDGSRYYYGREGDFHESPPMPGGQWRKALVAAGVLKEELKCQE